MIFFISFVYYLKSNKKYYKNNQYLDIFFSWINQGIIKQKLNKQKILKSLFFFKTINRKLIFHSFILFVLSKVLIN